MSEEDIVFLDDMHARHETFMTHAPTSQFRIWHVYSASAAIREIERRKPTQVFLDHDLTEQDIMSEVGQETAAPTGMAVVEHILRMESPPMDVVIHSCNGPAAEEMERRLLSHPAGIKVRRIPFPYLIHSLHEAKKRSEP